MMSQAEASRSQFRRKRRTHGVARLISETQTEVSRLLSLLEEEHDEIRQQRASGDRLRVFSTYFARDIFLEEFQLLTYCFLCSNNFAPKRAAKVIVRAGLFRKQQNLNRVSYFPCLLPIAGYDTDDVRKVLEMNALKYDSCASAVEEPSNTVADEEPSATSPEAEPPSNAFLMTLRRIFRATSESKDLTAATAGTPQMLSRKSSTVFSEAPSSATSGEDFSEDISGSISPAEERSSAFSLLENNDKGVVCVDHVLQPIVTEIEKYVSVMFHHWDKSGRPVIYVNISNLRANRLLASLLKLTPAGTDPKQLIVLFHLYFLEVCSHLVRYNLRRFSWAEHRQLFEVTGRGEHTAGAGINSVINSCTAIITCDSIHTDTKNLRKIIKSLVSVGQQYYPLMIHHIYVVNTSDVVQQAYIALRHLLAPSVRQKVTFCGSSEIQKIIEKGRLPSRFGGDCVCSVCTRNRSEDISFSSSHTEVSSQFSTSSSNSEVDGEKQKISVSSGKTKRIVYGLRSNEEVVWNFTAQSYVVFSAQFISVDGAASKICPPEKLKESTSHYVSRGPGTLILSWFNDKKFFSCDVQVRVVKY